MAQKPWFEPHGACRWCGYRAPFFWLLVHEVTEHIAPKAP